MLPSVCAATESTGWPLMFHSAVLKLLFTYLISRISLKVEGGKRKEDRRFITAGTRPRGHTEATIRIDQSIYTGPIEEQAYPS